MGRAPEGAVAALQVDREYAFSTGIERSPQAGGFSRSLESAAYIGTQVRFELRGDGVSFRAPSTQGRFETEAASDFEECTEVGTPEFRVVCRADRVGPVTILVRLMVDFRSWSDQRIDICGVAPAEDSDTDRSSQDAPAVRDSIEREQLRSGFRDGLLLSARQVEQGGWALSASNHQIRVTDQPVRITATELGLRAATCRSRLVALSRGERVADAARLSALASSGQLLLEFAKVGQDLHDALFGRSDPEEPDRFQHLGALARVIAGLGWEGDEVSAPYLEVNDQSHMPVPWGVVYDGWARAMYLESEGLPVPDGLIDPQSPDDVDPLCFWGNRFAVYHSDQERIGPPSSRVGSSTGIQTTALLNTTLPPVVVEAQRAALVGLASAGRSAAFVLDRTLTDPAAVIAWAGRSRAEPCDLLWVMCHAHVPSSQGQTGYPNAAASSDDASLGFQGEDDRDHLLKVGMLAKVCSGRLERRPLVILNACGSAQGDGVYREPFVDHFIGRWKARAMVGTDWDVPTHFADVFSRALLDRLRSPLNVLDAVHSATRAGFAKGNPFGLIYSVHGDERTTLAER